MKKLAMSLFAILSLTYLSSAVAAIKAASQPDVPFNGSDYVGVIEAAQFDANPNNNQKKILIMTSADSKNKNSQLKGLTLEINADDLPVGYTLASSIGKKVAVYFANASYEISSVSLITDNYYYGNNK